MPVYAIAQGRITDREQFARYLELSGPSLATYQGLVLALDETPEAVEGDIDYARTVVLEFADRDAFYAWYDSPQYRAARALRESAAVGRFILVSGLS